MRNTTFRGQEFFLNLCFEGSQAVPAHNSGIGIFERVMIQEAKRHEA
jgi:hypothetical protein